MDKALGFRLAAIKDFRVTGVNIVRPLDIPPCSNFFPKGLNYRALQKHKNKNFGLEEAVLTMQRSFYI